MEEKIIEYPNDNKLPPDEQQYWKVRIKAPCFVIENITLYKRGYLTPTIKVWKWNSTGTQKSINIVTKDNKIEILLADHVIGHERHCI